MRQRHFLQTVALLGVITAGCEAHDYWVLTDVLSVNSEQEVYSAQNNKEISQDLFVRYQLDYELNNLSTDQSTEVVVSATSYVNDISCSLETSWSYRSIAAQTADAPTARSSARPKANTKRCPQSTKSPRFATIRAKTPTTVCCNAPPKTPAKTSAVRRPTWRNAAPPIAANQAPSAHAPSNASTTPHAWNRANAPPNASTAA